MKKILLIAIMAMSFSLHAQQRYLDEVFASVNITPDVIYGYNVTVITGSPAMDTLKMDVYEPVGDTAVVRPLVIYIHTGSFLPVPLTDSAPATKATALPLKCACVSLRRVT